MSNTSRTYCLRVTVNFDRPLTALEAQEALTYNFCHAHGLFATPWSNDDERQDLDMPQVFTVTSVRQHSE